MNWKEDIPTIEGFYWLRYEGKKMARVVWIWNGAGEPMVAFCGTDWDKPAKEIKGAKWYGPLEAPI